MANRVKQKCEKCGNLARETSYHNGMFMCGKCHRTGKTQGRKRNRK